jgi:HTH-type transcriptional regulator/antitoxin HigA
MVDDTSFSPDWVSPPGSTIATLLEERGVTPDELARRIDQSTDEVEELLKGRATITAELARRLASALGATESFWTRRESQYQSDLARLYGEASLPESIGWLAEIPVRDIEQWGWIRPIANPSARVAACLQFFG